MGEKDSLEEMLRELKFKAEMSKADSLLSVIFSYMTIILLGIYKFLNNDVLGLILAGIFGLVSLIALIKYLFSSNNISVSIGEIIEFIDEPSIEEFKCPVCGSTNITVKLYNDYLTLKCVDCDHKWAIPKSHMER